MDETSVLNKLNAIFKEVFDDQELIITRETTAMDIDDWDSLMQITLIYNIEKTFNIKLSLQDVGKLQNVGDMIDVILSK